MNRQKIIDAIETFTQWDSGSCCELADRIIAEQGDDSADFHVRKDAPETSKAIVDKIRSGSLQEEILARFKSSGGITYTDDELEMLLVRSHQSVSACRNTLVRKGYLVDSGFRRMTRSMNQAIVWKWTGKETP